MPNPEYYTLRYADGPQLYITEQVSAKAASQASLGSEPPREVALSAWPTCRQLLFIGDAPAPASSSGWKTMASTS